MTELWRSIDGFNGAYEVSNTGLVRSNRFNKRIILSPNISNRYKRVALQLNGNRHDLLIHRLVGFSFVANPLHLPQINHIDGIKTNNHHTNLEWCTARENALHAFSLGLRKTVIGEAHGATPFKNEDILAIREDCKNGKSLNSVAMKYGVTWHSISKIVKRKTWIHI